MPRHARLAPMAFLMLLPAAARADGVLYRLPEDRSWVRYEVEITESNGSVRKVEVSVKSVGRAEENNEALRWIEVKHPMEDQTVVVKLLIPEKHLKEGEDPLEHVVRAWRKVGEENPQPFARPRDFWLQLLLAGPLEEVKKLEPAVVKSKLGALECEGLTGRANVREDDGYELALAYQVRRHPKAPFGAVTCRIECRVSKDGKPHDTVTFDLKVADFGKDAESELAGYQ